MSHLLQFLRAIWRRIAPESLRFRAHETVQDINASVARFHSSASAAFDHRVGALRRAMPGIFAQGPLRVVGLFSATHGIARGAILTCRALEYLGVPFERIDASRLVRGETDRFDHQGSALGWIIQMNPPELLDLIRFGGPDLLQGPRFGYWAWELPRAPDAWRAAAGHVEEIWAISTYTASAFQSFSRPVRTLPHPLVAEDYQAVTPAPRRTAFSAIALFDFNSSAARKNPHGAIQAFQEAFGDDPSARLTIKTQNGGRYPQVMQSLQEISGGNIEILDEVWDHDRVLQEIKGADVLVSLHRAEGFGLTMAEAMALGTPVLATAWSGNLDFMDDHCAMLVPYTLTPVVDEQGIYAGQSWADADVSLAACHLKRLRAEPEYGRRMAGAALQMVRDRLSPERWFADLPPYLKRRLRGRKRAPATV